MAITMTATTAGLAALATAVANGTDFELDSVQLGEGQYTPDAGATALMTPFSPAREFDSLKGRRSGARLTVSFEDSTTGAMMPTT